MNELSEKIKGEIAVRGAITFARFMELALYCPDTGFYEKDDDTVGRGGAFYTSVSVGPVFGELLAFQIADWMVQPSGESAGPGVPPVPGSRFLIIEAGAHTGRLAKDILTWLRDRRGELFEHVQYWIIEPSRRRRQWQDEVLKEFSPQVHWTDSLTAVSRDSMPRTGVIVANELLDAMPVHRLGWDARQKTWFEWGVAWRDERFAWVRLPGRHNNSLVPLRLGPELLEILPEGFTTEICPLAEKWWGEAAGVLRSGRLLMFDYGLEEAEFFAPHRLQGTLRAYCNQQQSGDLLAQPGQQDITAHVNLTVIRRAGEAAGLRTATLATQAHFLTGIAARHWQDPGRNGLWTAKQRREFQTLIHPQHLGRAFRVLLQVR